MLTYGLVAYEISRGKMKILEVAPFDERPGRGEHETLREKWLSKGKAVHVHLAPDEILQHHAWSRMPERHKIALGRVEVAIFHDNWDEAHAAIQYAQRGAGATEPIETSCAELGMSTRQLNALERHGITHVWQLLGKTRRELLVMSAIAAPSVDDIIARTKKFCDELKRTGEWQDFCLQLEDRMR